NNFRITKKYRFQAKADTVYWVQTKDHFRVGVRVEGPGGPVDEPNDRGGGDRRPEGAFLVAKDGAYTAVLECDRNDAKPCKLIIRGTDGAAPLPSRVKLKSGEPDLPRLAQVKALNVYDKQFSGAAFAPDSKHFWMAHGDGTLTYWEQPGAKQKGSFKTSDRLF